MKTNLDQAGARHGHRERGEGAPWNFAVRLEGQVVTADLEAPAARLGLDTDGDGQADVLVQIGPVVRGTALRDVLPFVSFSAYANQIEFAQLAGALNERAIASALAGLPRAQLLGRRLSVLGAFTDSDELPLVTPVRVELRGAK